LKKILITGGTGFIGLNLIKRLKKRRKNISIYVLTRKNFVNISIFDKTLFSDVRFIKGDIVNFKTNIKFDEIYHLAYDTLVNRGFLEYTSSTILQGIINISKICIKNNVKKLYFLSSGAVYENNKKKFSSVEDNIIFKLFSEKNHYGIMKAASENYIWSIFKNSKTKIYIFRVFAVIGPYMRLNANFIIGKLIDDILKNKSSRFKTDCKVFRNFIHIDNLLDQMLYDYKKNFVVKNIVGKTIRLDSYLIQISNKYNLSIKFGIKKNTLRIHYSPNKEIYSFKKNYLIKSFDETLNWFKNNKIVKVSIDC
tara:strand:+ start:67 stop:993 length:927 start_codon:yes stop_codon:yes gene_type:complete